MPSPATKEINGPWVRNVPLARYFNSTPMSLFRWKNDPKLETPPSIVINNIEYNNLDEWKAWALARVGRAINRSVKKKIDAPEAA